MTPLMKMVTPKQDNLDGPMYFDVGLECPECGNLGLWLDDDEHEYCDCCGYKS